MTDATLVFLIRGNEVLLAMKKRGFGVGFWNGVGGKIQEGETPVQAAQREAKEEIGVDLVLEEPLGVIHFHNSSAGDWTVSVFRASDFSGEPAETEEMRPCWYPVSAVPYQAMHSGDEHWMPHVLAGKAFHADMWFDADHQNVRNEVVLI